MGGHDVPMNLERSPVLDHTPHPTTRVRGITLIALAFVAAALVGYATAPFGPAGDHFAMNNVFAAENLLHGEGVFQSGGEPFLSWPPLLPWILAALRACGLRYVEATWIVTVCATFATTYFHARLLFHFSRLIWIAVVGVALVFVAPTFLTIMSTTLSQPLFMALSTASVWLLVRWIETPTRALEIGLAALGLLACLHRYDGVILVGVTACVLWRAPNVPSEMRRLARPVLYSFASVLPMFAWLLRNRSVSGTWTGERVPSSVGFVEQWNDVARTAAMWIVPMFEPGSVHTALAVLLTLATAVWLGWKLWARERARWIGFTAFAFTYGFALIVLASRVEMDTLGERLAVPVMPFLLGFVLLALADSSVWPASAGRVGIWLSRASVAVFALVHLAWNTPPVRSTIAAMRANGAGGLSNARWIDSDVARWLREHEVEGELFTNSPVTVLFGADRAAELITEDTWRDVFVGSTSPKTLVWVFVLARDRRTLNELRAELTLETLAEFETGCVFRVLPRGP